MKARKSARKKALDGRTGVTLVLRRLSAWRGRRRAASAIRETQTGRVA